MKIPLRFGLFALLLGLLAASADAAPDRVTAAIVKIYSIYDVPDYYNPWSMRGPTAGTGSGCVIKGRKILTNAHVVGFQTFLQVRRYGQARRYQARVLSVSHEADLALLTVDDERFFDGIEPLELGELPESQDEVLVFGFPLGGDTLSITKGVISRIEHQTYVHSSVNLLAGQIDAAINPGNSGGPVLKDERIVGVVMQGMAQADNIGYMVPVPILRHFFRDLEDGRHDGFPSMGVAMQDMENDDLKRQHGMDPQQTGLLIYKVVPGSPADGRLEPGDVLTEIDGHPVADDGTIEFRPKQRTSVSYFVQQRQQGESLPLTILRAGERREVSLQLNRALHRDLLVPMDQYDVRPSYYIYGGLVFCPVTKNLLKAWGPNWYQNAPNHLVNLLNNNTPEVDGEEAVILLKVLPSDLNEGYHQVMYWLVEQVDGRRIRNLRELMAAVEQGGDPFVTFTAPGGQLVTLDRAKVKERQAEILATYRVPSDRSADLRAAAPGR